MKNHLLPLAVSLCFLINNSFGQGGNFTYTGEVFNDPDWGWSYKTSESDRTTLKKAHDLIKQALSQVGPKSGDYQVSVTDMSFAFDPVQQESAKKNGSKCVTCYYSNSPRSGSHFRYQYTLSLELQENSESYMKAYKVSDSLNTLISRMNQGRKGNADSKAKAQAEMEKLQKEIEQMSMHNLTEAQVAEIERKAKRIEDLMNQGEGTMVSDDTLHAMNGDLYAGKSNVFIETNSPLMGSEKSLLLGMKNKAGYYFREVSIPGADFACIYFDKYNKLPDVGHSNNPVLLVYFGKVYSGKNALPADWLTPFCTRLTYSGNLPQIQEMIGKINFSLLKSINH